MRWLAAELARLMPADNALRLDMVAHSQGGLVGRMMCEQAASVGLDPARVQMRNLVMAATPNAGTPLSDPAHLSTFIILAMRERYDSFHQQMLIADINSIRFYERTGQTVPMWIYDGNDR